MPDIDLIMQHAFCNACFDLTCCSCRVFDLICCPCRVDAGKVELDGAQYLGFRIPLSITALVWIEAILVGGAEVYRNGERDPERRVYPGQASTSPPVCTPFLMRA